MVLIRLLIPLQIPSPASAMNVIRLPPAATVETHASDPSAFSSTLLEPQPYFEQLRVTAVQAISQENTSSMEKKPDLFQILFILWTSGALAVFVYMTIFNGVFLRRLRQSSAELEIPFYRDLCRQIGIKTPLPVVISQHLTSPCLVGLFRPYIAITPEAVADRTILRHVLLHELCHFKQKDNLFSLLRNICCVIYWFNPLVWMAALASRDDSELSCDDRVLRYLDEKESLEYGHTLLSLLSTCHKKVAILNTATAMANGKSRIKTRISMIINRPKTLKAVSVLAAGLVILLGVTTLTSAKADEQQDRESAAQVGGGGGLTLADKADTSPMLNGQRTLDIESLRLLAKGELTFSDIINGYKADEMVKDETYQYTAWRYALDNGLRFDLQYIQEKNLPDRYTASLSHSGSNYIFFPCRAESLEQFLTACAQGDHYSLKAYASFDAKKVAEIEYDEAKQVAASLRVFDEGRTYTLNESGSFGRVCWSPDSVYGAFINMTTLDGRAGGDNCAYLYDSQKHQFYGMVSPQTILTAFNERGTFDQEVTQIYLRPRIQWSPDSKKLLLSCYPAINGNHIVAYLVYNVAQKAVEDIVMQEVPKTLDEALSWEW